MAEAAVTAAEADKAPVPTATGISMKMVIVIGVAALVLGLGGAFALFKLMSGGHGGEEAKTEAGAAKGESHGAADSKPVAAETKSGIAKVGGPGVMFDVESFIVNLADVQEVRYLKITVKLELETQEASAEMTSRMPQIRDTILVLLTSKDSASIRTTQGKFQLRDEITQRINSLLSKPTVRTVYFTDFVVQ
jgi:flagellar FliL protein